MIVSKAPRRQNGVKMITQTDLKFRHPCNIIVNGASGSGKTEWCLNFLKSYEHVLNEPMEHVMYCYGVHNSRVFDIERMGIETFEGLPTLELLKSKPKPLMCIFDDLMLESKSDYLSTLFTRASHHFNMTIVFLTQQLFSKELKVARNNAHYLVLLRDPAGQLAVRNLGVQIFPGRLKYYMESYKSATDQRYGYLLVDIHPSSHDSVRLRTDIFSPNSTVFVPK